MLAAHPCHTLEMISPSLASTLAAMEANTAPGTIKCNHTCFATCTMHATLAGAKPTKFQDLCTAPSHTQSSYRSWEGYCDV